MSHPTLHDLDCAVGSVSDASDGITAEDVGARVGESDADARERRAEQKKLQKAAFDASYDQTGKDDNDDGDFYSAVKQDMAEQQQRNLAEFADEDDLHRLRLEGGTTIIYFGFVLLNSPVQLVPAPMSASNSTMCPVSLCNTLTSASQRCSAGFCPAKTT